MGTALDALSFRLQEQNLLAAPLIVREESAIRSGMQEVVILLEDFSWTEPRRIFDDLRRPRPEGAMNGTGMNMAAARPDLNDVTYDAFLANDRTLADPQVIDVEKGAEVRLRIINGAASSNFVIDLGAVSGTVLTVDGNPVEPLVVRQFPLAIAQRVDIAVRLPADATALPYGALRGADVSDRHCVAPARRRRRPYSRNGGDGRAGTRSHG